MRTNDLNQMDQASLGYLLSTSDFFLRIKYNNIRHLNKFVESTINEEDNQISELVKEGLRELILSEEIPAKQIESQTYFTRIQMKSIFRVSLFISSFSLFETELSDLAKNVEYYIKPKFKETDLKNNGILRSKTYLSKCLDIEIKNDEEWKFLELYQKVRNAWVHNKGKINDANEALKISKTFVDLAKSADNFLYLQENFIVNFLDYSETFLNKIADSTIKCNL